MVGPDIESVRGAVCARQAAELRRGWRAGQGAATIFLDECSVRIGDAAAEDPEVSLERLAVGSSPSRAMVAELMILAGQVAAAVGARPMRASLWTLCLDAPACMRACNRCSRRRASAVVRRAAIQPRVQDSCACRSPAHTRISG